MSQSTATTTTPHVTVMYSSALAVTITVTMGPTLMGLSATSGQHDLVLLLLVMPRNTGDVVGLTTLLQQQPQSQMPLQAYATYAMGPPQESFSFRVELPTVLLIYVGVMVYAFSFRCHSECHIHQRVFNHQGLHCCSPLEHTHGWHMCILVMVIGPWHECTELLLPPLL